MVHQVIKPKWCNRTALVQIYCAREDSWFYMIWFAQISYVCFYTWCIDGVHLKLVLFRSQIQVESTGGFSKAELTTPWNPGCNQFQPPRLLLPPGYTTARLPYLGAGHQPELRATLKTLQPTTDSHIYPQTLITMIIDYDTKIQSIWKLIGPHNVSWRAIRASGVQLHILCATYIICIKTTLCISTSSIRQDIQHDLGNIFKISSTIMSCQHTTYWLHNVSCWSNLLSTDAS